jgi:hypothetical protein
MDWRTDNAYAFCAQLDPAGWAWQFLRREPEYRADYAWFINLWQQLEATYGAPPHRDFFKWKQDPRAWRTEFESTDRGSDACSGQQNQVLIECWMSAKWGLRKFPINPSIIFPEDLAWNDFPIEVRPFEPDQNANALLSPDSLALIFDLSLSLPAQLEDAKQKLIAARQRLTFSDSLQPRNCREGEPKWRLLLRLLDALEYEESLDTITTILDLTLPDTQIRAANAMSRKDYRRILMLER